MKKFIIFSSIVLSLVLFSGFVCALGDSVMDLRISGTKEISTNAFQLTYSVETSNVDSQKAIKENKEISDDLYKSLNSMINKTRGDYVKTSNYSVNPQYDYKNGKNTIKGYNVYNTVKIYVKDITSVSKFVDLSSTKGVTRVNNLSFQATDYDDKCNELMAELAGKAKRRANATLNPLNMQVLTVKSISTSCSQSSSYSPVNYAKSARALGASEEDKETSTTPIEAGKMILNGSLNTTFYIGAKK